MIKVQIPSAEEFGFKPCVVGGDACVLIHPKNIGAKWNKDNMIFRSSMWRLSDWTPVSLSFQKFYNWAEHPELVSTPSSMKGVELMEKVDGSTLIVSKYKGEYIIRTRGTVDASKLENGFEIEILKQKYPRVFTSLPGEIETSRESLVFEWVSPTNKIVISYGDEPELYLTAVIDHNDYSLRSQDELDSRAVNLGVKRPRRFKFNTFDEMFAAIQALDYAKTREFNAPQEYQSTTGAQAVPELARGFEGFCVYFGRGQHIRKVKSAWYLALHKLKSELSSFDKVLDLWITLDCKSFSEFYDYVLENIDYEIAEQSRNDASKVADATKEVERIIAGMQAFAESIKHLAIQYGFQKGRAAQAKKIFEAYGQTNRASYVFSILDGKQLSRDAVKKLYYQVLKK